MNYLKETDTPSIHTTIAASTDHLQEKGVMRAEDRATLHKYARTAAAEFTRAVRNCPRSPTLLGELNAILGSIGLRLEVRS
jgi:hypothetical protein